MERVTCREIANVQYWDNYAKWYELWVEHNYYHNKIIEVFRSFVEPDWKVLDIGAGNGVLSLSLSAIGNDVTALEPSKGMRRLLFEETFKRGIDWIKVDKRKWEDVPCHQLGGYDLIIACNTLHLIQIGFEGGLKKIFQARPKNIFVITELGMPEMNVRWQYGDYKMMFTKSYETESSFAYHHMNEVFEHWSFIKGRILYPDEKKEICAKIIFENDHLWIKDTAYVGMYWWWRNGNNK
jgi:SAM-dependent methyltransferase